MDPTAQSAPGVVTTTARRGRRWPAGLIAVGLALTPLARPDVAAGEDPALVGSGSSYAQPLVDRLSAGLGDLTPPLLLEYTPLGSKEGREEFLEKRSDFGLSDQPFTEEEKAGHAGEAGRKSLYAPLVGGALAFPYKLLDDQSQPIAGIQLSANTLAKIFTGQIQSWDNDEIVADNGGVVFSRRTIRPVVRSDSNGTTWAFSSWLKAQAPEVWTSFTQQRGMPDAPTERWPPETDLQLSGETPQAVMTKVGGIGGVAGHTNAIGYTAPAWAEPTLVPNGVNFIKVKNAAGNYVLPTSANAEQALAEGTVGADNVFTPNYLAASANAYPVVLATYLIAPLSDTTPERQQTIARFLQYVLDHQDEAAAFEYARLPAALSAATRKAIADLQAVAAATTTTTTAAPSTTTSVAPTSSSSVSTPSSSTTTGPSTTVTTTGGRGSAPTRSSSEVLGSALAFTGSVASHRKLELGLALLVIGEGVRRRQLRIRRLRG